MNTNTDPFLRGVIEMGFQDVAVDQMLRTVTLSNGGLSQKYSLDEFELMISKCTVKGNKEYKWISDADGSSEVFKNFIENNYIRSNSPS